MRKPSAEVGERVRFLWIVVHLEVGTLQAEGLACEGSLVSLKPFSLVLSAPCYWARGTAHPKGSPRPIVGIAMEPETKRALIWNTSLPSH